MTTKPITIAATTPRHAAIIGSIAVSLRKGSNRSRRSNRSKGIVLTGSNPDRTLPLEQLEPVELLEPGPSEITTL